MKRIVAFLLSATLFVSILFPLGGCVSRSGSSASSDKDTEEQTPVPDHSTSPSPSEDENEEQDEADEPSPEEIKERAQKVDEAIWKYILSAEKNYNKLIDVMDSSDSLYDVYSFCEDVEDVMDRYTSDLLDIWDSEAQEYINCAQNYFWQIRDIAENVKNFSNTQDMEYLSKAEDGMAMLNTFIDAIVVARFSYLSACGFTDEEIIEIGEES